VDAVYVLVHSPLVGTLTWSLVAQELERRGISVVTPELIDVEDTAAPYWQQHAQAVAKALAAIPATRPLIFVGHSGAGPLLPALRKATIHPVAAYVFVDAGLPEDGKSRLDLMASENLEFADYLRRYLADGGRFPNWTEPDLQEIVSDPNLRAELLRQLRPRSLAFFEEPLPVFAGWPDAPCNYVQFSSAYDGPATRAQYAGWHYCAFDAGHFHMLEDPVAVASALLFITGCA
jgi:pimeloyl-ACP methyl ester carboxylesterase